MGEPATVARHGPLHRSMGGLGALLITLSALSPSIGVFVVGSDVLRQAGTGALWCFAAAGLLALGVAAVYAELASAFPETGGEYTIVARALGLEAGFAMLGLNILTFSVAPAVTGLGVAAYLDVAAPGLPAVPTAMALVAAATLCGVLNVRLNAGITGAFLALEVATLATVAWLGLAQPHRGLGEVLAHPVTAAAAGGGGLVATPLAVIGAGVAAAVYAFDGYGSAVYLGEELRDAPRRIARVVLGAVGLGLVMELAPLTAVATGAGDLGRLLRSPSPLSAFVEAAGGRRLATALSLGVAAALLNAMIANALMAGRQLYSSGRDRAWPAGLSRALAGLHPRFNSPWIATLVMGATSLAWCLVGLKTLVTLIGDGTAALYGGMCLAALQGRRRGSTAHAAYRLPLFPVVPLAALAGLAAVAGADLFDADGRAGLACTAATIGGAVAYYRLALRHRGRWAHRGPHAGEA